MPRKAAGKTAAKIELPESLAEYSRELPPSLLVNVEPRSAQTNRLTQNI